MSKVSYWIDDTRDLFPIFGIDYERSHCGVCNHHQRVYLRELRPRVSTGKQFAAFSAFDMFRKKGIRRELKV